MLSKKDLSEFDSGMAGAVGVGIVVFMKSIKEATISRFCFFTDCWLQRGGCFGPSSCTEFLPDCSSD